MPAPAYDQAFEALRMRRAELRESMSTLEQALAAPGAPSQTVPTPQHICIAFTQGQSRSRRMSHTSSCQTPIV
jgi:hypothetical protein